MYHPGERMVVGWVETAKGTINKRYAAEHHLRKNKTYDRRFRTSKQSVPMRISALRPAPSAPPKTQKPTSDALNT